MGEYKTISWTGKTGRAMELRARYSIRVSERVENLDGDKINMGKEVVEDAALELWVDGKREGLSYTVENWIIYNHAKGFKAIKGLPVGMTDEQAVIVEAFLAEVIASAVSSEVEEIETEKEEKEMAEKIEIAKEIIAKVENGTKLMSAKGYEYWKKQCNNFWNEGGEGYIPERITTEQYEWAKKILEKNKEA